MENKLQQELETILDTKLQAHIIYTYIPNGILGWYKKGNDTNVVAIYVAGNTTIIYNGSSHGNAARILRSIHQLTAQKEENNGKQTTSDY